MRNTTRGTAASLASGLAITIGLAGCTTATTPEDPVFTGDARPQLVAFDSCGTALKELKQAARPYVGAYGFGFGGALAADGADSAAGAERGAAPEAAAGAGAEKSAPDYSGTNTHEAGVDEPDLVKTDGRRIVTVADGVLRVVDVAARRQTGALKLPSNNPGGPDAPDVAGVPSQLLMHGDRALVVLANQYEIYDAPAREGGPQQPGAQVLLVDLADGPRLLSRMKLDGEYVDARAVDGTVRLVTRSIPRVPFGYPDQTKSDARAQRENQIALDNSQIEDWLPRYEIDSGGTVTRGQVGCGRVSRPATYTGTSMLTVTMFGLEASALSADKAISIVADGSTVYGTGDTLYVASDQRMVRTATDTGAEAAPPRAGEPAAPRTSVYLFDTSRGTPRHVGSGAVPGWLINQYAMSEHDGYLRVATTTDSRDQRKSSSAVYVLARQGKQLKPVGQVSGLGKGERIYAVRFTGPVGYVVTFRQTDPLYTLDLRDPREPKVTGELKITGYSAYLHPAAAGRLIGIGQEADTQGRTQGTQVSLFDVSDLAAPRRLAQYHLRYGSSEAEYDPHAFLYWPKTGLLVIPVSAGAEPALDQPQVRQPGTTPAYGGALVLKLSGDTFTELGSVSHPQGAVRRSLIIDQTLWTVSQSGLLAVDAGNLTQRAWIPFTS
ncbi:MAG: beta-propeller domain-containing protein [Micromonosporaceae bacterium]